MLFFIVTLDLHSKAFETAALSGKSLSQFIQEAIKKELESITGFSSFFTLTNGSIS